MNWITVLKEPPAKGFGTFQILSLENGEVVWESPVMKNRILDAGWNLLIKHHDATLITPIEITSLEIGTGSAAVLGSNTALAAMVTNNIPPAKITPSTKSIQFEFFIVDAELPDGTYREIGLRSNATLYTRALFTNPYVKAAGRDTIIRYTLSYDAG